MTLFNIIRFTIFLLVFAQLGGIILFIIQARIELRKEKRAKRNRYDACCHQGTNEEYLSFEEWLAEEEAADWRRQQEYMRQIADEQSRLSQNCQEEMNRLYEQQQQDLLNQQMWNNMFP